MAHLSAQLLPGHACCLGGGGTPGHDGRKGERCVASAGTRSLKLTAVGPREEGGLSASVRMGHRQQRIRVQLSAGVVQQRMLQLRRGAVHQRLQHLLHLLQLLLNWCEQRRQCLLNRLLHPRWRLGNSCRWSSQHGSSLSHFTKHEWQTRQHFTERQLYARPDTRRQKAVGICTRGPFPLPLPRIPPTDVVEQPAKAPARLHNAFGEAGVGTQLQR